MQDENFISQKVYLRLLLLWIICESFLIGILPSYPIPFLGVLKAGLAVICICLFGYFVPKRGAILLATLVVLAFKIILNPFTSLNAFTAVLFQGICGQILFSYCKYYRLSCVLLSVIVITTTAIQGVITRIIFSNANFFGAVNETFQKTFELKTDFYHLFWIIAGYFILHVLSGILIGIFAANLIRYVRRMERNNNKGFILINSQGTKSFFRTGPSKRFYVFAALILLVLLFTPFIFPSRQIIFSTNFSVFLRGLFIFFAWNVIAVPILEKQMYEFTKKNRVPPPEIIRQIVRLFSQINYLLTKAWQLSASQRGISRLSCFLKISLFNMVQSHVKPANEWV